MFGSTLIETVIGLVFVFSLTAILVTQINNIISSLLNLRAKNLKQGLSDLVTDKQIRAKLLAHPIIDMVQTSVPLGARLSDEDADNIANIAETNVTYIPASTFAEAIVGILVAEASETLFEPLRKAVQSLPSSLEKSQLRELLRIMRVNFSEETLRKVYELIDTITDEKQQQQLLDGLHAVEEELDKLRFNHSQLVPLLDGVEKIADQQFKSALKTVLTAAKTIEEAQLKIQNWFDDSMSRVSQKFATRLQRYSFIVALTLTVFLNIDALFIGRTLWEDPELRQSVAATASTFDQARATPPKLTDGTAAAEMAPEELQQQVVEAQQTVQNLLDLQVPLGWQYTSVSDKLVADSLAVGFPDPRSNPRNLWSFIPGNSDEWLLLWIQKLIGLAITTIAASQGAPFWFDLLNKIARR